MSNPPEKKRRRAYGGPLAVGSYVPGIARRVFEARGFPSAGLLADWPEIIGHDFAAITVPERLVWPRRAEFQEKDAGKSKTLYPQRRSGATLVLRVEGPRALEVQHAAPQLLERINVFFGYRAVSDLRLVQGPVRRETQPTRAPSRRRGGEPELDHAVEDEPLRAALARLGAGLDE
jgi:hypothetical protein